jgi:flagellar basal body-associated protein FliL
MKKKSTIWILVLLGVLVLCYSSYAPAHPSKKHKRQASHIQSVNAAPSVLITFTPTNTAPNILPGPRQ